MIVKYKSKNITSAVKVLKADIVDNAGGIADTIELCFSDVEGYWSSWKPLKGDEIEISKDGFTSGIMFIDHIEKQNSIFVLKGISTPLNAKQHNSKTWENIGLINIAEEFAAKYGFRLSTYNINSWHYNKLSQVDTPDLAFLSIRCMLEGYAVKVNNKNIIIYDEGFMEQQNPSISIDSSMIDGEVYYRNISCGLYNKCIVSYGNIKSIFNPPTAPYGPTLKKSPYLESIDQADRFAGSLLRHENKKEVIGCIPIKFNSGIASAMTINCRQIDLLDGNYFVDKVVHKLIEEKSIIAVRKPLEGY